ncbi:MAG: hypothetical protein ACKO4Q_00650, partial [Planctomycetota bacterium]
MGGATSERRLEVVGDLAVQVAVARRQVCVDLDELQGSVAGGVGRYKGVLDALAQRSVGRSERCELATGARAEIEQDALDMLVFVVS